ncbi:LysR family transcriptional regulator [Moritella marina]|uniref:LysR family transcriptional regulator n=1 Tax=Moritella marina TaxID=90736 RepID=UPI003703C18A
MLTLEQMKCFCAVYEQGSYSAAAKKLKKDRSTVREHVTSLEDSLGFELFAIEGRKSIATEFSDSLYYRASILTRHAAEIELGALSYFDQNITEVNIYHDVLLPHQLVLFITKKLMGKYPTIQLNWLHRNREETIADIMSGQCQLAIMPNNFRIMPEKQVWYRNLGLINLAAYAGVNSQLTKLTPIGMKDLQLEKQFLSENHIRAGLDALKVSPNYHIISNNDVLIELIKDHGWAVLAKPFAQPYVLKGELIKLDIKELTNNFKYGLSLYFSVDAEQNKLLAEVIDWICAYAKLYLD